MCPREASRTPALHRARRGKSWHVHKVLACHVPATWSLPRSQPARPKRSHSRLPFEPNPPPHPVPRRRALPPTICSTSLHATPSTPLCHVTHHLSACRPFPPKDDAHRRCFCAVLAERRP